MLPINMRAFLFVLGSAWLWFYFSKSRASGTATATAGPFNVKIDSVNRCEGKALNGKNTLRFTSKMQRVSRNKLLVHVNASFLTSLSDNQKILVNLAKQTSQGWKDNYFITELPRACTFLLKVSPSLRKLLSETYKVEKCPIPAGNYSAALDMRLDAVTHIIPAMEYGRSRARIFIRQGPDTLNCVEAMVEFVPKKPRKHA